MHPVEKQEQDIEGESQATKDHAADQETVAALSLEYLPEGKTDTDHQNCTRRRTAGSSFLRPLAGSSVRWQPSWHTAGQDRG